MFRCQYCGSHIFLNEANAQWRDLSNRYQCPYLALADGTYKHAPYQSGAFYVHDNLEIAEILQFKGFQILRTGNLRLWIPAQERPLRNTMQVVEAGMYHDKHIEAASASKVIEIIEMPEFTIEKGCWFGSFKTLNEAIAEAAILDTQVQLI